MSITSIGWNTDQVIQINKADMTLIQSTPVEIYRLDTDVFFTDLKDEERTVDGMPWPDTQRNASPVTLGGITYARVLEIIDPYTVTFEDDTYVVQLVGSNNNIIEKTNSNQVSVQGNNAAGLIQVPEIQYSSFQNGVTIDQANGTPGQTYPAGTPLQPVDNLDDALFIANLRGFDTICIRGTYTFAASDVVDDFIFEGDSPVKQTCVLTAAASITNCVFRSLTITGALDGGNSASACIVSNINYIDGSLQDCLIAGTLTLGGTSANILRCGSGVAGGGVGLTPTIDFNNQTTDLLVRDWQGGMDIVNKTTASGDVSIDMSSGRVIVQANCTAGDIYIRGISEVVDSSTGTCNVVNQALFGEDLQNTLTNTTSIETKVDTVTTNLATVDGKIDVIDTNVDDIESLVITVDTNVDTLITNLAAVDGKIDVIDTNVDDIETLLGTVNTKIDVIDTNVDSLSASVSGLPSAADNADAVWDEPIADHQGAGSAGEWIVKKLLTVSKFIGLG